MKFSVIFAALALVSGSLAAPVVSSERAVDVDLGGIGALLKREQAERAVDVDLGGINLAIKRGGLADLTAPLSFVQLPVNAISTVSSVLDTLGLKKLACTLDESDIKVSAANDAGLALVTVTGACLLQGTSVTVPLFTGA